MNYAQTYHIGNNQHTRTEQAKSFAPTIRRVRKLATKTKGHKPSAERQAEVRTNRNATNGILKCTFLPKLKTVHSVQACQKTERDFYKSLSKLAKHYSIEPMQSKDLGFPYNIVLSMWDIDTKLKRTHRNWDSLHLLQGSKKTILQSKERFNVGMTLFYVPIVPLFQMLKDPKRKKNAQLLLSVCSYLYHIARIPYYRQEESYLYWLYETHKDWIEYEDTDETETYKSELRQAECIGDIIEQKLYNLINLMLFEQRLSRFESLDTFDKECWQVACNAFALYTEYPKATIFRNAPISEQDPYADDYEMEAIIMDKYIAFVADTKGLLYNSIVENINSEFNEFGVLEEPSISIPFNGKDTSGENLDFENRMFDLLDDLYMLLENYKTTKK